MTIAAEQPVVDISAARIRVASVKIGVWLTHVVCGAAAIYVALTWQRAGRRELAVLVAIGTLGGIVVSKLPAERIVRSRWCEAFFLGWSALDLLLISFMMIVDGGTSSPIAPVLFAPAVFSAMSYPSASVVAVGAFTIICYAMTAIVVGTLGLPSEAWFGFALVCASAMSAWQARNHGRQHALLGRVSRADPLTGCLNRRGFEERAEAELLAAKRAGGEGALLLIDLDGFKLVNDCYGHVAGDALLCWVVATLERVVRPRDAIGRLGGDEFAVLLPDIVAVDAVGCASRIRTELQARTGASIGVASYPQDGLEMGALLHQADTRMYASRPARRDPVALAERLSWAETMAHAVDSRMNVRHDHSRLVAGYAAMIAVDLGWNREQLGLLRIAATLHDIGKFSISDRILCKPGPLTDDEFAEIRKHPELGSELVSRIEGLEAIVGWIRHSHERFDGRGYPDGLSGEEIPQAARIIFVADAFDAMTSDRPYHRALDESQALAELRCNAGTQFDPAAVDALHRQLASETSDPFSVLAA